MQSNTFHRWLTSVICMCLLIGVSAAQAATGARVLLQAWNPLTPDQPNVITLLDHPSLVSDSIQDAWTQVRPKICTQLGLKMGLGGAARGETLYDIACLLDEQLLFDVSPAGSNALRATLVVSGYVEATSTTPDVAFGVGLGDYADPRFSVALTARLELILAVQPNRDRTLRVSKAQFTLNNATLDSHNFSGDMLKFVAGDLVPFFGGPDYKRMAEDAVNEISANLANDFNATLDPVNELLKGPSDAVRVGVSGRDGYISVAFAPREVAPPSNGRMSGVVRWDPTSFTPRNGCRSFEIGASVQTGPAPMFAPGASAPVRQVGVFQISPIDATSCGYTLSGLAEGWPNALASRVLDPPLDRSSGNANYRETYTLSSDTAQGGKVVPLPSVDGRNYTVRAFTLKMPSAEARTGEYLKEDYRNPEISRAELDTNRSKTRINPAEINTRQINPAAANAIKPRVSPDVSASTQATSLNPQPLPPAGSPTLQTRAVGSVAAARLAQVSTAPAPMQSSRSAAPPVAAVSDDAGADSVSTAVVFAPPLLDDGAQLWVCINDDAEDGDEQSCAGVQSAEAFCQQQGYSGGLEQRIDGTAAFSIADAQAEVPVRAINGDTCLGDTCRIVSELSCVL